MRSTLSPEQSRFVERVQTFVDEHWPEENEVQGYQTQLGSDVRTDWFGALVAEGWSVPTWPEAHGGPGWSRGLQHLFELTLAERGALSPMNSGSGFVGPLLIAHGSIEQQAHHLADIREGATSWCVAVADAEPTQVSGTRLFGRKAWVTGAQNADWMLVWADGWWVLPLATSGVQVEPVAMMGDELDVCAVHLDGASAERIDCDDPHWQPPLHPAVWTRGARLSRSLHRLERLAAEYADDADLKRERDAIAVALSGLNALEARAADTWIRGEDPHSLTLACALQGVETGQELSALAARSMGYYALPYPDAMLLSNEGVIGNELALPAVKQMLFDRAWSLHTSAGPGKSTERLRNQMAAQVLGLPQSDASHTD